MHFEILVTWDLSCFSNVRGPINVKKSVIKDEVSTENDIKQKLNRKKMEPEELFKEYFRIELDELDKQTDVTNIHIFTIIISTGKCLPTFYLSNKKFAVTKY